MKLGGKLCCETNTWMLRFDARVKVQSSQTLYNVLSTTTKYFSPDCMLRTYHYTCGEENSQQPTGDDLCSKRRQNSFRSAITWSSVDDSL